MLMHPPRPTPSAHQARQRGFTMVELVMVITIMGVIGGVVAVFMKSPIEAYFYTARRAGLSDVADTVSRRMARDIQQSLPNSLRTPTTSPANQCVEFIPTTTGGRYRADLNTGTEDILDFTTADTSFDVLGNIGTTIAQGDVVVVYNLGISGADAYDTSNSTSNKALVKSTTSGASSSNIVITGDLTNVSSTTGKLFPFSSPGKRFHIVSASENVVSYVCNTTTGRLTRTASTFAQSAATSCPTTGSVLATNVSYCNFDYSGSDLYRNGLIRLTIQFTDSGETVSLTNEVHINNSP